MVSKPLRIPHVAYNLSRWEGGMLSCIDEIYFVGRRESKKRFRSRIYALWGSKCAYCGEVARSLDHVLPRHKGGLTVIENLIPACLSCNGHKGSQDFATWYRKQHFYDVEREALIWLWINQNSPDDDAALACAFFGGFSAIEQLDFLSAYAEVDNAALNDRLADDDFT